MDASHAPTSLPALPATPIAAVAASQPTSQIDLGILGAQPSPRYDPGALEAVQHAWRIASAPGGEGGEAVARAGIAALTPKALLTLEHTLDHGSSRDAFNAANAVIEHALPKAASGAMRVRVEMSTHMLAVEVVRVDAP